MNQGEAGSRLERAREARAGYIGKTTKLLTVMMAVMVPLAAVLVRLVFRLWEMTSWHVANGSQVPEFLLRLRWPALLGVVLVSPLFAMFISLIPPMIRERGSKDRPPHHSVGSLRRLVEVGVALVALAVCIRAPLVWLPLPLAAAVALGFVPGPVEARDVARPVRLLYQVATIGLVVACLWLPPSAQRVAGYQETAASWVELDQRLDEAREGAAQEAASGDPPPAVPDGGKPDEPEVRSAAVDGGEAPAEPVGWVGLSWTTPFRALLAFAGILFGFLAVSGLGFIQTQARRGARERRVTALFGALPLLLVAAACWGLAYWDRALLPLAGLLGVIAATWLCGMFPLERLVGRFTVATFFLSIFALPFCAGPAGLASLFITANVDPGPSNYVAMLLLGLMAGPSLALASTYHALLNQCGRKDLLAGGLLRRWASRPLPTRWMDVPYEAGRVGTLRPLAVSLAASERRLADVLERRLKDPLADIDAGGALLRGWKRIERGAVGTPLEPFVATIRSTHSDSKKALERASEAFCAADGVETSLARLHAAAWLVSPRLLPVDLARAPEPVLRLLADIREEEDEGVLELFWRWSEVDAQLRLGRLHAFQEAVSAFGALVASSELDDKLGAASVVDLLRPPTPSDAAEAAGEVLALHSSSARLRYLSLAAGQVSQLMAVASVGGDQETEETLRPVLGRLLGQARSFVAEAGGEAQRSLDLHRAMTEVVERRADLDERETADSSDHALLLLMTVFSVWLRFGFAPLLAKAGDEPPLAAAAVARCWLDQGRAVGFPELDDETVAGGAALWLAMLAGDEAPDMEAVPLVAGAIGDHLRPDLEGWMSAAEMPEGTRKLYRLLYRLSKKRTRIDAFVDANLPCPWRHETWSTVELWTAAAEATLALGAGEEANRLADQLAWIGDVLEDRDVQQRACALKQRLSGGPIDPVPGVTLTARQITAESGEARLRVASDPQEILRILEDLAGGEPGDGGAMKLGPDEQLLVQAPLPEGVLSVLYSGCGGEPRKQLRRLPRGELLRREADLRYGLEGGFPVYAEDLGWLVDTLPCAPERLGGKLYYLGFGALGRLPLSVLPTAAGPLGKVLPWARVDRPSRAGGGAPTGEHQGVALWWDQGHAELPNARPECEALHRFERDQASRARVLEVLSSERALHLACHGRAAGVDEGDAHLALSDGQLLADDLRRHPIRSPLVYLSACESAKGVLVPGEPSRGLAGALVDGGAQAVVATQWVLSDAAAPAMARTFWGALDQGLESSEALRLAREQASGPPGTWAGLELHLGQRSPVSRAALQISLVE